MRRIAVKCFRCRQSSIPCVERLPICVTTLTLSTLEPALLEVAAQMSHISRELATVYADEKIERARNFLKERQEEVNLFNSRLDQAKVSPPR